MKDQFTLITGAGAGIGRELAIACAKKGFHLLLVSLPGSELDQLSNTLSQEFGVKVYYLEIDLLAHTAPQQVYGWCLQKGYIVDKLINNAGIGGSCKFDELALSDIQTMILLNTYVITSITNLFLPMLRQQPKAYILNVSSTASFFNIPYKALYAATKAFVNTLTSSLRNELAGTGIVVSVLCPGGSTHKRDIHVEAKVSRWISDLIHETPASIAKAGIDGLLAGKRMILPGIVAKCYVYVSRLLPARLSDPVVRRLFAPPAENSKPGSRLRQIAFWCVAVMACLAALYYSFIHPH